MKCVKIDQTGQAIMPEMGQARFTWEEPAPACNNGINHSQDAVKASIEAKYKEWAAQWSKIATAAYFAAAVAITNDDKNTKQQMIRLMSDATTNSKAAMPPNPRTQNNIIKMLLDADVTPKDLTWAKRVWNAQ